MTRWTSVEVSDLRYGPAVVPEHAPCVIDVRLTWACRAQAPVSVTGTACAWPLVAVPEPRCLESSVTVLCEAYTLEDGLKHTAPLITDSLHITGLSCDLTSDEVTQLTNQKVNDLKNRLYADRLTEWCSATRCSAAFDQLNVAGPKDTRAQGSHRPVDFGWGSGTSTCTLCPHPSSDPEFNRRCPSFAQRFGNPPSSPPAWVDTGYFDQCVRAWGELSKAPRSACFTPDEEPPSKTENHPRTDDLASMRAPPGRCVRTPLSDELRALLTRISAEAAADGGLLALAARPDADLLRDFVRAEPALISATFGEVAALFPDDECWRTLLEPMLERRARECAKWDCRSLNRFISRRDFTRAIERDGPSPSATTPRAAWSLTSIHDYSMRASAEGDGGLRLQVVSPAGDGGLQVHTDATRDDAAAQVLLERGMLELRVIDSDAPTTFGAAGGGRTWRSSAPLAPGDALAACANGALKPLGRFLGIRAVWQTFPEGWTRVFEYQLPCASTFVVPGGALIRPGAWRAFRLQRPPESADLDPGPPYVNGTRVRRFGAVSYRETVEDPGRSIYGKRCRIEATVGGAIRSTDLSSSYGCQLEFVADFNSDGIADLVVHKGGESCEHNVLYLSGPGGWQEAGLEGSCE